MSSKKRYYWLKLKEDFFNKKAVKRLRKIAGGDTYTIIYLKLLLLGIKTDGKIYFDGFEDSFAEEIALELDEDEDNVSVTLTFLLKHGLAEMIDEYEMLMTETASLTGSESSSAERVRRHREKKKKEQLLQCNTNSLQCNTPVTKGNTEIEIDIEIDKEIEIDDRDRYREFKDKYLKIIKREDQSINYLSSSSVSNFFKRFNKEEVSKILKAITESDYLKSNLQLRWLMNNKNDYENAVKVISNNYKNRKKEEQVVTKLHNFEQSSSKYSEEEIFNNWMKGRYRNEENESSS